MSIIKSTFMIAGLGALIAAGPVFAGELPHCPVMDEPIDFSISTTTDEGPVYFCCAGCIKKYEENPQKYAGKVAKQREKLSEWPKVQVLCPVSGKPVDSKVSIEQDGQQVHFCCQGCVSKYQADPKKYAKALAGSYTYQTKCPVMGGDINPAAFVDLKNGKRIFFCCPPCQKKLVKDPQKYAPKLVEQGFASLDAKTIQEQMPQ